MNCSRLNVIALIIFFPQIHPLKAFYILYLKKKIKSLGGLISLLSFGLCMDLQSLDLPALWRRVSASWGTQGPGRALTCRKFTKHIHSQGLGFGEHQERSLLGLSPKRGKPFVCPGARGALKVQWESVSSCV